MGGMFELGGFVVEAGRRSYLELPVANRPDGTQLSIPVLVVNGVKEGPTLFARGGTHGDEFEAMQAIADVGQWLDPKELKGVFMGVPMANVPACLAKVSLDVSSMRESPVDYLEISGVMPGRSDGTMTERIAHVISNELFPKANYAMDLHSGGDRGTSVPLAGFYDIEDEFGRTSFEMARMFPIELMWSLSTKGRQFQMAYEKGVPLMMAEVNGEGRCRKEDVQIYVTGIKNVMKHLGMIGGEIEGVPEQRRCVEPETYLYSQVGGFLRPNVETGQEISKGDLLGEITDVYGRVVEKVVAPFDGLASGIRTKPIIWPGEAAFLITRFVTKGILWS
jgi:predicted deacylase